MKMKMHFTISYFALMLLVVNSVLAQPTTENYSKWVNPFIGTGGHGHTFPGPTMPFGACQLSPDTRLEGWDGCSGYHYSDSVIYGFSHTHLSGTGCSDYGDILLMPVVREMRVNKYQFASHFSHQQEKATAGYYSVFLDDPMIKVELTSTLHGGVHRYTFPQGESQYVVLDLKHRDEVLDTRMERVSDYTIRGYRFSKAWAKNQKVFFEISFSSPIDEILYEQGDASSQTVSVQPEKSLQCLIKFKSSAASSKSILKNTLLVKCAISGVDTDGARKNRMAEMPDTQWDFDYYRKLAEKSWNKELAKVNFTKLLSAADKLNDAKRKTWEDEKFIFYTALYHCMIHPSLYSDVDGRYRGRDDKIHSTQKKFDYYTVFSLWDTYRALHPLLSILDKKRTNDFIQTFIMQYEQGGRLPVWELSSNETNCMIGYHVVSVIWDAYNKGIRNYNAEKAFEAMKSIATYSSDYEGVGETMRLKESARDRAADADALESYCKYGYVRADDSHESVSKTLEYAYNDWCIAQMARALKKDKEYDYYLNRSQNWINVYDPNSGFMRARKNGCLYEPFSPYTVDNNFTEANSWQYSFYLPHDVLGYLDLLGSRDKMEKALDNLFTAKTKTEGREQSDITGLIGQYAHGNEPSHHIVFLYNYLGKTAKMNQLVNQICDSFYLNAPDGLIGNEDCGQMSAWYVCAKSGIYPTCPGENNYDAVDKPSTNLISKYLNPTIVEDKLYHSGYADNYQAKRKMVFPIFKKDQLSRTFPMRMDKLKTHSTVPFIQNAPRIFSDSVRIEMASPKKGLPIYYCLNNDNKFQNYTQPFYLHESASIKFYSLRNTESYLMQYASFTKLPNDRRIILKNQYNPSYSAGGAQGLMDGIYGKLNWRAGDWQGYQGQDIEVIMEFAEPRAIKKLAANFLEDQNSWIFYPKEVEFYVSQDSLSWTLVDQIQTNKSDHAEQTTISKFETTYSTMQKQEYKYAKLVAKNFGPMPQWHEGRGNPTFIFIDEFEVK
jgi:predicted alpha-1,2-mannosidase